MWHTCWIPILLCLKLHMTIENGHITRQLLDINHPVLHIMWLTQQSTQLWYCSGNCLFSFLLSCFLGHWKDLFECHLDILPFWSINVDLPACLPWIIYPIICAESDIKINLQLIFYRLQYQWDMVTPQTSQHTFTINSRSQSTSR